MTIPITEPYDEPVRVVLPEVPTAVLRHAAVTLADLPAIFDGGYVRLAEQVHPAGPAFAIYRGDPSATFDLELGFPVRTTAPDELAGSIPAGEAYALTHVGGYDALGAAWERLLVTVPGTPSALVEVYVTEPSPTVDPATLRTDLYALL